MKILFFPEGDYLIPATRYRVYFVAKELKKRGFLTKIVHFKPLNKVELFLVKIIEKLLPKNKRKGLNFYIFLKNNFRRFLSLIFSKAKIIFLQRSIDQNGIKFVLKLAKKLKKKIIFDFDDAIYLKNPKEFREILKISDLVLAGNPYLKERAIKYNSQVEIIPTLIPSSLPYLKNKIKKRNKIILGWTGLPYYFPYFKILKKPLEELGQKYSLELRIISQGKFPKDLIPKGIGFKFIKWNLKSEWEELAKFDIGIMPLLGTELDKGKCGFKLIQYMAMGIPSLASKVGENINIIDHQINGFLASNQAEWKEYLEKLILSSELREKIGIKAREKFSKQYTLEGNIEKYIKIIKNLYGK
jgi:glycosyltransferase involved in cell wall biosynthesis